ncbi:MAG TPA: class I SAM-dependent methyltransferase [Elusimicrobiota bacterium]|nr:class I SAM-dependent methyltransferase [Elusimicrobiota bacterium]
MFYDRDVEAAACYATGYFRSGEYWNYEAEQKSLDRNFGRRINDLKRSAPSATELLEIGCAYGFFLKQAQRYWRVEGYDISVEAAAFARGRLGLNVQCAEFLDAGEMPGRFDIICLWDTLEHLRHPVRALEKASRWLRPGGVLALTTGDVESVVARWRGARWRQIHPPSHLYYFSPRTITTALTKSGLRPEKITYPGQYRNFAAMAHKILDPLRLRGVARVVTANEKLDFPVYLNLFDTMCAIARKPADAKGARG